MFKPSQNWLQLSAIQVGGAFSLPVFMIGYFLGCHYSFKVALLQLMIGNSLLLVISLAYLRVIVIYRLITVEMGRLIFGRVGEVFASVSMLMSMLGWCVIQWQFMKNASVSFLHQQGNFLSDILQGNLQTSTASLTFLVGLMMVVSVAAGLLFDLPTFYRHARSQGHGMISLVLLWMVAVLGIECFGLFAAQNHGILGWINHHRWGFLVFILLTGSLTNGLNVYSSGMVINRLFKIDSKRAMILVIALTGALSVYPIGDQLPILLQWMGASGEAILCVTLSSVFLKGMALESLTDRERRVNQHVYFISLFVMVVAFISPVEILKNMVVTVAIVSIGLMCIYYGVKFNEATN